MKRGRKSISSLMTPTIDIGRAKVMPVPKGLTKIEADIFTRTARLHPHLTEGDSDQLAAYCQAVARTSRLVKKDDTKAWDLSVRAMVLLARSLRITSQSKVLPDKAGRASRNVPNYGSPSPWEPTQEEIRQLREDEKYDA